MIWQKEVILPAMDRGSHLVTHLIESQLPELPPKGLLHIHLAHTSAGITLNENADPTVRQDFNEIINHLVPENQSFYRHTLEGGDDMPAHMKCSLIGVEVTIPIRDQRLALGTWQGIYFCEFRDHGGRRKLILTIYS